jgi:hypothetical protein
MAEAAKESGRGGADGAKLSHDAVHDAPSGAAREEVRQRRVAGGFTLERSAVYCAGGGFRAQQIGRSNMIGNSVPSSCCRVIVAIQTVACAPRLQRNKKVNTNPARNPPMCAM